MVDAILFLPGLSPVQDKAVIAIIELKTQIKIYLPSSAPRAGDLCPCSSTACRAGLLKAEALMPRKRRLPSTPSGAIPTQTTDPATAGLITHVQFTELQSKREQYPRRFVDLLRSRINHPRSHSEPFRSGVGRWPRDLVISRPRRRPTRPDEAQEPRPTNVPG
jgi:hypothetical protein